MRTHTWWFDLGIFLSGLMVPLFVDLLRKVLRLDDLGPP